MRKIYRVVALLFLLTFSFACRQEIVIEEEIEIPAVPTKPSEPGNMDVVGFYLLNEGNMGSNKCTLDYFDAITGEYHRNIYASRNPGVVKELGDVGNDLLIYGSKMYAVVNCSHKVEVMKEENAEHIAKIDIPNCRYAVPYKGDIYVSSYVGPVQVDASSPKGAVFKVDTLSLSVKGSVEVGYQPEEMTIIGNRLYVANSGGYDVGNYDNTISVIDLDKFELCDVIELDGTANFHRLDHDGNGLLWLSSRGDYYGNIPSSLYVIDPVKKAIIKDMQVPVSDMWMDDGKLYIISTEWSYVTGQNDVSYAIVDMELMKVVNSNFLDANAVESIVFPYGIAVNPVTKDIYVADAKSFVVTGTLHCFSQDGVLKWSQRTGQIPAHFAFRKVYSY